MICHEVPVLRHKVAKLSKTEDQLGSTEQIGFEDSRGFYDTPYGKCCAKLDSSTTVFAALPCRLDISADNFKRSDSIRLRAASTLQSAANQKDKTRTASFCAQKDGEG